MLAVRPFWQWVKLNIKALFSGSHYVRRTYHSYNVVIHASKEEPTKNQKKEYATFK